MQAYVTASAVLMTLGLKDYKFQNSIVRILLYPSKYYPMIGKTYHIGEYNPRLKKLVFSAEELKEGFRILNDGINLGIHEVSHALLFGYSKQHSRESRRFRVGLKN